MDTWSWWITHLNTVHLAISLLRNIWQVGFFLKPTDTCQIGLAIHQVSYLKCDSWTYASLKNYIFTISETEKNTLRMHLPAPDIIQHVFYFIWRQYPPANECHKLRNIPQNFQGGTYPPKCQNLQMKLHTSLLFITTYNRGIPIPMISSLTSQIQFH